MRRSYKYICSLDFGTREIKAGIFRLSAKGRFIWEEPHIQPLEGLKEGSVCHLDALSECIYQTVSALAQKTGLRIKDVYIGLNGSMVSGRKVRAMIPLIEKGRKMITRRDIRQVNKQARLLGVNLDEDIIHQIATFYQLDTENSVLAPQGLYGRKLGVQALVIVASTYRLAHITKAVHQAGFEVADIVMDSYTVESIVLSPQQKQKGCVLLDIGANTTGFLVFKEGGLRYYQSIDQGGGGFTRCIAKKLNVSFDTAEDIKKSYAQVMDSSVYRKEEILVKKDEQYVPVDRRAIDRSLEQEIFLFEKRIQEALSASGLRDQISGDMFVTGGGALLPGLIERLDQQLPFSVELARVRQGGPQETREAALFSPAAGIAYYGFHKGNDKLVSQTSERWFQRVAGYLRDLYEEYF